MLYMLIFLKKSYLPVSIFKKKIELKVFENLYALIFPELSTYAILNENFIKFNTLSGFFSKKFMFT